MNGNAAIPLAMLAVALVAVVMGYLVASPLALPTLAVTAAIPGVLLLPLVLRWHHVALIFSWNAALIFMFLPGQPALWIVVAFLSLGASVVTRTLSRGATIHFERSVGWPLVVLTLVVLVTVLFRGGFGGRALGSEMWGGKRYLGVLAAVVGFFALTARVIPREKAVWYGGMFFLTGTTAIFSDVAFALGRKFYFLYSIFPSDVAFHQATTQSTLQRYTGVAVAAQALFCYALVRHGVGGVMDFSRPWRPVLFMLVGASAMFGGFRSSVILLFILFWVQFFLEGLHRSKLLVVMLLGLGLLSAGVVGFVDRLPLSVQRSLSFLPLNVDPTARHDALGTFDWRLQMWRVVIPEVPQYLLLGKGYGYSGMDYWLTQEAVRRGMVTAYEDTLVSGNYHNGFLTLIIPFGLAGFLAFVWFCAAAIRLLVRNYRHGDPELRKLNTFLLTYFVGRLFFYTVFYGQFDLDLMVFTGVVGLSLAANRGRAVGVAAPARRMPAAVDVRVPAGSAVAA